MSRDGWIWMELVSRITTDEREYRRLADKDWQEHEYVRAIRFRGIADGLEMAREHQARVIAEAKTEVAQ